MLENLERIDVWRMPPRRSHGTEQTYSPVTLQGVNQEVNTQLTLLLPSTSASVPQRLNQTSLLGWHKTVKDGKWIWRSQQYPAHTLIQDTVSSCHSLLTASNCSQGFLTCLSIVIYAAVKGIPYFSAQKLFNGFSPHNKIQSYWTALQRHWEHSSVSHFTLISQAFLLVLEFTGQVPALGFYTCCFHLEHSLST